MVGGAEVLCTERLPSPMNLGTRALRRQLRDELQGCESVLDRGCGRSSILREMPPLERSVGVQAHRPALDESRRTAIHTEYIEGDARREGFRRRGYDIYGIGGLKANRRERTVPWPPRVVTRPLASLSRPAVFRRPRHAFHLLAVRGATRPARASLKHVGSE